MFLLSTRDFEPPRAQRFVSRKQGRGEGRLLIATLSMLNTGSVWTDDVPSMPLVDLGNNHVMHNRCERKHGPDELRGWAASSLQVDVEGARSSWRVRVSRLRRAVAV